VGYGDPLNLPEDEFDAVMTEIDKIIRARNGQIPGREIVGYAEYAKKFRVSFSSEHPAALRIFAWFERIYGDRLKMDWDFGRSAVLVQGEICKIRSERFYGTRIIVCSPVGMNIQFRQETRPGEHLTLKNLLVDDVGGLTPDLARRLPAIECEQILRAYGQMFLTFSRLETCLGARRGGTDAPFIKEAMHDLGISVDSLLTSRPDYGQAKWESLQAAEKFIKSCILEKGVEPKKTHNLSVLCAQAATAGFHGSIQRVSLWFNARPMSGTIRLSSRRPRRSRLIMLP
jgi:hypothetical protein